MPTAVVVFEWRQLPAATGPPDVLHPDDWMANVHGEEVLLMLRAS